MEQCRQCGARLAGVGQRCGRCGDLARVATLRGGPVHDDATLLGERTLLGPPQLDDQPTLLEDELRFEGGRIVAGHPTETLGSVGSTLRDAPVDAIPTGDARASAEEARASAEEALAATAVVLPAVRPTRALLEPGDEVEGYRIEREIGRGGMGRVYAAEHAVTGQQVALKMLLPQLLGDARLKARFVNEAKVLARLEHPNLVQLLGFIDTPRAAFIVMPFVAGSTLDRVIQRHGQLPIDRAVHLFSQMCEGLDHMHRHAVMHRDLKPSNVLIQADDRVRITDFGIARAVGSQKLTMEGMVVGTAEYLAPEQASGTDRDNVASDQYAVAILLYEMLTGRVPFRHPSAARVLVKQVSSAPPPPRTIRPEIPAGVEAALLRALAKAPADRFSDVLAFRDAVVAALDGGVVEAPAPAPLAARPARRHVSLILQILLGAIIGAGVAALAWHLMQ
ncbi:MAG: serine/threonine-protein kinase [bacterium]